MKTQREDERPPKPGQPIGPTRIVCVKCGRTLAEVEPPSATLATSCVATLVCACGHEQQSGHRGRIHQLIGAVSASERWERKIQQRAEKSRRRS